MAPREFALNSLLNGRGLERGSAGEERRPPPRPGNDRLRRCGSKSRLKPVLQTGAGTQKLVWDWSNSV
jgi:hypothetical protein